MAISPDENLSAEIIRRARQGDRSAFETIVRRYQRTIRAWVAAHCPPGGDVDDVAPRNFPAAFARIAEFEEGTDFRAWLFAIARFQFTTRGRTL